MNNIPFLIKIDNTKISEQILEGPIRDAYSNFSFYYFQSSRDQNILNSELIEYFRDFKFLTYYTFNSNYSFNFLISTENDKKQEINFNSNLSFKSVICIENECLILEQINENIFNEFIAQIQESASIIKYDYSSSKNDFQEENEEFQRFYDHFKYLFYNNAFVKKTMPPIIGYLIRRFFYPTEYFRDQLFFEPNKSNNEKSLNDKINEFLSIENKDEIEKNIEKLKNLKNEILNGNFDYKNSSQIFHKDDFVILRDISGNAYSSFYLVFHLKTFKIFLLKKIFNIQHYESNIFHEISFCRDYSHRCITPFYGFLVEKDNDKDIIGLVYKFMVNGTLDKFITKKNNEKVTNEYLIKTIIRIYNGIYYLYKTFKIHRDLKPSNIFLDNDFMPFVSDFDTVQSVKNHFFDDHNNTENQINDNDNDNDAVGTITYASPELMSNKDVSFSTDVFSFGLIIYFLFEKKNLWENYEDRNNKKILKIKNCSENIQYLYENCVKLKQDERLKNNDIKNYLYNEVTNIICLNNNNKTCQDISQIFFEFIMLNINDKKKLKAFIDDIFCSIFLNMMQSKKDKASLLLKLGHLYENGDGLSKDYYQAKRYYKLSINEGNCDAYVSLGDLYSNGYGVYIDYEEAKKNYDEGFKRKSSLAAVALGDLYFNGHGVNQNYIKAKEYYEIAAKQDNQYGYLNLGILYENGLGVIRNYEKSLNYYIKASSKQNAEAFFLIGNFFLLRKDINTALHMYLKALYYYSVDALNVLSTILYFQSQEEYISFFQNEIELFEKKNKNIGSIQISFNYSISIGSSDGFPNMIHYPNKKNFRIIVFNAGEIVYQNFKSPLPNNSNLLILVGNFYFMQTNIDKNYLKAKCYYELARQRGNSYGMLYLGLLYERGYGVNQDHLKALKYYEESAELNNLDAYFFVGKLYYDGKGIGKNYYKARINFEKAASFNNSNSYIYLAIIYLYGFGIDKNYEKAFHYFKAIEESENSDCILNLGYFYYNGYGIIKKDYFKAKEYFEKSVKLFNPDAHLALGYLYENGYGVPLDYSEAFKIYKKLIPNEDNKSHANLEFSSKIDVSKVASEKCKSEALFRIGSFYEYGKGVNKNYKEAKNCYELSCELKNSNAFLKLAYIYEKGIYEKKDFGKAFDFLNLAAQSLNSSAFVNLGRYYENGFVVTKDFSKAKKFYEKGSKENNSVAFLFLGKLYEKGLGVEQNYLKAKDYYEMSAKYDISKAYLKLGKFYYYGKGVEKNYKISFKYYQLAAYKKNPEAIYYLGVFYSNGIFCKTDIKLAIKYYLQNIELPNKDIEIYNSQDDSKYYYFSYNKFLNHSCNNLGVIYITYFEDIEKAFDYINKASSSEFSFAQNNLGLLYQFYYNNKEEAEYKYSCSSRNGFTLAKYNLGFLMEIEGKYEDSIKNYIKASNAENEPFMFRNVEVNDFQLEISKTFIICLTNLKLTLHFLNKLDYSESKKYFIRAFAKIKLNTNDMIYNFHYVYNNEISKNAFSYLKKYILEFPLFNQKNQFDFSFYLDKQNENKFQSNEKNEQIQLDSYIDECILKNQNKHNTFATFESLYNQEDFIFKDQGLLFDFIIKNNQLIHFFIEEIKEIISEMASILYKPPYAILFGRISLEKRIENQQNNIDQQFYDGFYN